MATSANFDNDRTPPRRHINKQQAIRHLLHAAIRLVMTEEDPFAIHLIIHSADKLIIDMAKSRKTYPLMDWELYIKDEYHSQFFKQYRETYNYLKHAKDDSNKELPVHDIMGVNIFALFMAVQNYIDLFKDTTQHMALYTSFVLQINPKLIAEKSPRREELLELTRGVRNMTPRKFFEIFKESIGALPNFPTERAEDLQDVSHFYDLTFEEFRAGQSVGTRSFKFPI